jgi:putative addiction module CopG family antidote
LLPPRGCTVIDGLVKSGRYQNASEVMREGLRMIEQREKREAAKLEALRKATRVVLPSRIVEVEFLGRKEVGYGCLGE